MVDSEPMSIFRHTLLMKFTDEATPDQIRSLLEALLGIPDEMGFIRRYEPGLDLGLVEASFDMALVADFDSEEDWRSYNSHPAHLALVDEHLRPILAKAVRVQYEVG